MAGKFSFNLSACEVHQGTLEKQRAEIAAAALREIRARPLAGAAACTCASTTPSKLSFAFVPAPPPPPPPPSGVLGVLGSWTPAAPPLPPPALRPEEQPRECYVDQYTVGDDASADKACCDRFGELLHGTMIKNVIPTSRIRFGDKFSELLGPTGHFERFAIWSHLFGFAVFFLYAIVRQVLVDDAGAVEAVLASVAAWTTSIVFLASVLYHATAPDPKFAMVTRTIDFIAVYLGLGVGATADVAVATRGFDDVPVVAILDIPIAAVLLIVYFVYRRWSVDPTETWLDDRLYAPTSPAQAQGCSVGRGLFARGHDDLEHACTREATSFLLATSYFAAVPAAVATFGGGRAALILSLQVVGFLLIVGGMVLDNVVRWPDTSVLKGTTNACAPNSCGCIVTSHGVWHILAFVSAALTVAAREYALTIY